MPAVLSDHSVRAILADVLSIWSRMARDQGGSAGYVEEDAAFRAEGVPKRVRPIFRRWFSAMSAERAATERRLLDLRIDKPEEPAANPIDWKSF